MQKSRKNKLTRRTLIKSLGAAGIAASTTPTILPKPAASNARQLRILRWKNFVPASETWFMDVFVKQWSAENDIDVQVDNVGLGEINRVAYAETEAGAGHDLVLFVSPRATLEDHVIDLSDLVQECETRYGKMPDAVHKSCFNPKTGKYHGFAESFYPTMVTYRKDLWDAIGKSPSTWEDVRKGGRAIKLLHEAAVGISVASEHNAEHTLRALLYSFGGSIQNADAQVTISSSETIEALKFAKNLFDEAMSVEMLSWGPSSNNQFMLSGNGNLTIDTMSIIRAAENKKLPVNDNLGLAVMPEGPGGRIAPMFGLNTFVIWKFSKNQDNAKKFLLDYIGRFQESFVAGGFQNMPVYPKSVPEMTKLIRSDSAVAGRYHPLIDVPGTMSNLGFPGYSNAAIDEVMSLGLITRMFANVITGSASPQDSLSHAATEIEKIFEKWRIIKKI